MNENNNNDNQEFINIKNNLEVKENSLISLEKKIPVVKYI